MSAPLPDALRARFKKLLEEGLSGRAAALRLKLSRPPARVGLLRSRAPDRPEPRRRGKLDPYRSFLIALIDQDGDITMPELAAALADGSGVQAHPDAIGRFLRKLGFTYKKTLVATKRRRARVRKPRDQWVKPRQSWCNCRDPAQNQP